MGTGESVSKTFIWRFMGHDERAGHLRRQGALPDNDPSLQAT